MRPCVLELLHDTTMVVAMLAHETRREPQATHRLHISEAAFRSLVLAIYHVSVRERDICSPRQLLTAVLNAPESPLLQLEGNLLNRLCDSDVVAGRLQINIRIDSAVNDQMRLFREHAELRLGRPVSVAEAVYACSYVANLEQLT